MNEVAVAGIPQRAVIPSAAKRHAFQDFAAEILEGADAYQALGADWRRLAESQTGAILFQTHSILSTWARHFARNGTLATVVVRREGRVVLIWPLFLERRGVVRVASGAGAPIGQYDEILLDPDTDGRAALSAALDALMTSARPDLVLLERVRADSALRAALDETTPICSAEAAPYTDLSRGVAAAVAGLKPIVAKKQRKRVRRIEKEGEIAFAVAGDAAEAEAWLVEALALKRDWLRSTGRMSRAFIKAETGNCLAELARTHARDSASPRMVVSKLSIDGRTAAIEAALRHRDTYHLYLRAFAPEFAALGPGNVLTERMLGWCAENGVMRYDMLAPRSRNKAEWTSKEVAVFDFALPMTLRGRLYAELVLKRLAPALRDAFYALPPRLRSAAASVALRM